MAARCPAGYPGGLSGGPLLHRVALVGPESTGKTTLATALARRLGEPWVPEHARGYLERLGRPYEPEDLVAIARGQLADEEAAVSRAHRVLVCDTNVLVVRIWSEVRYGTVDPRITAAEQLDGYALHLLTAPDLPWAPDPQREDPHGRDELFLRYRAALEAAAVPFVVIRGTGPARLGAALHAVGPLLVPPG